MFFASFDSIILTFASLGACFSQGIFKFCVFFSCTFAKKKKKIRTIRLNWCFFRLHFQTHSCPWLASWTNRALLSNVSLCGNEKKNRMYFIYIYERKGTVKKRSKKEKKTLTGSPMGPTGPNSPCSPRSPCSVTVKITYWPIQDPHYWCLNIFLFVLTVFPAEPSSPGSPGWPASPWTVIEKNNQNFVGF